MRHIVYFFKSLALSMSTVSGMARETAPDIDVVTILLSLMLTCTPVEVF